MPQIQSRLIVGKKENVSDELLLLNPYQIPVLSLIGYGTPVTQTHYEWIEDKLNAMKDQLNGALTDIATSVVVDAGELFRPDQVIRIGEELLLVTAVTTNTLTVTRGYGSTTPAAALDNAIVEIMFNIQDEGADARDSKYKARNNLSNITQIFDDTVKISGTAQATAQYGIDDLYLYERMKIQDRLALELENALVNGIKFESGDRRMMGGIRQFIKTNITDAAAAALTWDMINTEMYKIMSAGGMKDATRHVLMCSPFQNTALTKLDKDVVRTTLDATGTGRNITTVTTNYGVLPIITNINFKPDEVMILDANRMKAKPLNGRAFTHEYLGHTGDNIKGQVIGEYTLGFKQEEAHSRIKNLKIS
jgi:hypothetical protein